MDKSTEKLENELRTNVNNNKKLGKYLDELKNVTVGDYLYELMEERGMFATDIMEKCTNISDKYIYSIVNGSKTNPSREKIIIIACGLGLTIEETNTLLKYSGYGKLYAKDKDDAIIIYSLEKGLKPDDIEELLVSKNSKYRLFRPVDKV